MGDLARQQIDNYHLIQRLGEGSFGEVFLAEHINRKKKFAVKILRARLTKENLGDFLNEARAFRLDHPNIMHIRDFGIEDDVPFLVMDYVPGGTLRGRHALGTRLALSTIIPYVKQIGEALQYAHNDGLVHRDVKPENILVGVQGEVLLTDFGIVTTSYTWNPANMQGVAGTALYMAPEQINGKPVRASDQYALASIVYEWLTGKPPFQGTMTELVIQHIAVPPPSMREQVPSIPKSVEMVVLKGLAKDPKDRFASVIEFADALEQANKRPVGTTMQVFKNHAHWVTAIAWSHDSAFIASASNDTTVHVWATDTAHINCTYHGHTREVTAVTWSPDGTRIASASSDRTVQIWNATTGNKLHTFHSHTDDVLTVSWSPDGKYIASAGCDKAVQVWDVTTGNRLSSFQGHADDVCVAVWSPDSTLIASAGYDKMIHVRDVMTGKLCHIYRSHSDGIYALAWSPDGKYIASASYDKTVQIREVATSTIVLTYLGHADGVFAVAWSPDSRLIASGADDNIVQIWQFDTGHILGQYRLHTQGIRTVMWSPDGQYIASGGVDKTVHIWQAV